MKKMSEKVVYQSERNFIEFKSDQFWEIEEVFGKIKGLREFKFRNLYEQPNGIYYENLSNLNVCHLKSLLELLKKMESDGFLDNENVI